LDELAGPTQLHERSSTFYIIFRYSSFSVQKEDGTWRKGVVGWRREEGRTAE
jgi:hypothetical protein